jgi:hypothetical protein
MLGSYAVNRLMLNGSYGEFCGIGNCKVLNFDGNIPLGVTLLISVV